MLVPSSYRSSAMKLFFKMVEAEEKYLGFENASCKQMKLGV